MDVSHDMKYRLFFWRYNISLISWNCKSQIWLFLAQSPFSYIYMLFWMYLMIWNIVVFFWRYNISLISCHCQFRIYLSLSQSPFIYIYIYIFFFAVLNVSHDIKYRLLFLFWRYNISLINEIANLKFDCVSLNLHYNVYISFFLFWVYLMIWNIVNFFWRHNILLISWNCQSHIWLSLSQPSFRYICIIFAVLNVSRDIKYRLFFFFGDIIFHWYHEIANLIFVCLSLNLHVHIYI